MQENYADPKRSEHLVRSLRAKVQRRLSSISTPVMSGEDIEQELWIAWCKARDSFDPDRGIPFGAYVWRGMMQHINRQIERHISRFKGQTFALSINAGRLSDDGEMNEGIPIPDKDIGQEEKSIRRSCYRRAIKKLSPDARTFVRILDEQPPEILQEVMLATDKEEHAKNIGAPFVNPRRITSKMVFDLMGLDRSERRGILKEVKEMGVNLSNE
jgi:DNA-directed RNA polymerase specialized sigma24 family protein